MREAALLARRVVASYPCVAVRQLGAATLPTPAPGSALAKELGSVRAFVVFAMTLKSYHSAGGGC